MSEREPFVSGLPGGDLQAATLPPALRDGLAALQRIRGFAQAHAAALAPLTVRRWDRDTDEREPDANAIDEKAAADSTVRLVDGILADRLLTLRCAAMLARGK